LAEVFAEAADARDQTQLSAGRPICRIYARLINNWHLGRMDELLLGSQVLIWFSGAYVLGIGGFWISFVETLPTA
jgi:hypothetical protein